MTIKSTFVAAALLGVFATAANAAVASASTALAAPAPAKVVSPTELPRAYRGSVVTVRLKVDASGRPSDVRVQGRHDERLVRRLTEAVRQWSFTPARRNGVAVSAQVELPLELAEG